MIDLKQMKLQSQLDDVGPWLRILVALVLGLMWPAAFWTAMTRREH